MTQLTIEQLNDNFFTKIAKEWMLISAGTVDDFNMMTASWGGIGWLWNKPVAFVFIRPERHTVSFIDNSERMTLSFLGFEKKMRDIYALLGSKSGRDIDKMHTDGLTPQSVDGSVMFAESEMTIVGKKLFAADMAEANFIDKSLLEQWYGSHGGMHRVYVIEIEKVLAK